MHWLFIRKSHSHGDEDDDDYDDGDDDDDDDDGDDGDDDDDDPYSDFRLLTSLVLRFARLVPPI